MIGNFYAGSAAINQLCALTDTDIRTYPIAMESTTRNFVDAPALSEPECAAAMAIGQSAVEESLDILCLLRRRRTLLTVNESVLDHCIVGHASAEPGRRHLLNAIGQRPLPDLHMRLGEGSGAALALTILKGAIACHTGMATFDEANVSGKSPESG